MKTKDFWVGIIFAIIVLFLLLCVSSLYSVCRAQNVTRQGNVFVQDSSSHKPKKQDVTLTKYFFIAADGNKYPIYMSANGKYFIIRKSSKTGKEYRQYLPEVTKQLSKK